MRIFRGMFIRSFLLILFTALLSAAIGQVRLVAAISPSDGRVCEQEMFEYRIILQNSQDVPAMRLPKFKSFLLLGTPARETGMSSVNGAVTRYTSWVYTLQAKKAGTYRIEPATAQVAGKTLRSEPVMVEVVKCRGSAAQAAPGMRNPPPAGGSDSQDQWLKDGEDPDAKARKNLQLLLEVSKKTCYVGEPIVAEYLLLSRLQCESRISKQPSFNGFSVVDMPLQDQFNPPSRVLNGKSFNVYQIRKSQIYPLQAGDIELERAEIDNDVAFVRESYIREQGMEGWLDEFSLSMLPGEAVVRRTVTVGNNPVNIVVKPLPEQGRPAGYTGAVGRFSIDAALQKSRIGLSEGGLLTVTVSGDGNFPLLTAPAIEWPAELEAFEPRDEEALDRSSVPLRGSKSFSFAFSAQLPGRYIIPPVKFSYFDPAASLYRTVESKALTIEVLPDMVTGGTASQGKAQGLSFLNRIFYHRWWIVVFVALLVLGGLLIWIVMERNAERRKLAADVPAGESPESGEDITETVKRDPLAESSSLVTDGGHLFLSVLNRELRQFISDRYGIPLTDINPAKLRDDLTGKSVSAAWSAEAASLLEEIEYTLYSPLATTAGSDEFFSRARDLLGRA